jgi:hypothetical protein
MSLFSAIAPPEFIDRHEPPNDHVLNNSLLRDTYFGSQLARDKCHHEEQQNHQHS